MAGRALGGRHVLGEPLAIGFGRGLVRLVQNGEDAGQSAGAVHQGFARLLGEIFERLGKIDAVLFGEFLDALLHLPGARAGAEAAIEQRLGGIGNHLGGVEGPFAAQSMTFLASSVRTVEGERSRLQLRNTGAAFGTRQLLRVQAFLAVDHDDQHQAVGELGGGLDGRLQAFLDAGLDQQPVHHNFDGVILAFIERDVLIEGTQNAIDARADKALAGQFLQIFLVFALAAADHRRHHHEAIFGFQREHVLQDLLGGLARDFVAADRAMRHADGGVEEAQVVVNLGDGADGGARAAAGGFLLDGNGGAQAVDGIDVGALHLIQELPGVGGEGLDVAALALGVNGIESQRGFARSAESGDDREGVAGDFDIDVLEIVLARAMHGNAVQHRKL